MKQLAAGAEAIIYQDKNIIIKDRIQKDYRIPEIDERLRKFRTRREVKVIEELRRIGIPVPKLIGSCDIGMRIRMEFLEGKKVRDVLNKKNCKKLCSEVGEKIGLMHAHNIIHGDLTTSNMILYDKIYFIDFGLSFFSNKIEDKAVDLHLLRQTLESKHHTIWRECFEAAISGYKKTNKEHNAVLERLERVEARGRYKGKH